MLATPSTPTNVFLTDASSGVGLELVRQLVAAGFKVSGVVYGVEQAKALREAGGIPAYAHLHRAGEVRSTLQGFGAHVVVHSAPQRPNHVPFVAAGWDRYLPALTRDTASVVQAAQDAGVEFLVMLGYAFVYGDTEGMADESAEPQIEDNPVVAAALAAETAVLSSPVPACVLRAGYVYGGASAESVAFRDAVVGGRGALLGGERDTANWVHADDLAQAVVRAIQTRPAGQIFNIVDDRPASTVEVARFLAEQMHVPAPGGPGLLARLSLPKAQMALLNRSTRAGNARARDVLGWTPRYPSYREGWERTLLELRALEPVG